MKEIRIETAENGTIVSVSGMYESTKGDVHVFNNPEELGKFIESWARGNEKSEAGEKGV